MTYKCDFATGLVMCMMRHFCLVLRPLVIILAANAQMICAAADDANHALLGAEKSANSLLSATTIITVRHIREEFPRVSDDELHALISKEREAISKKYAGDKDLSTRLEAVGYNLTSQIGAKTRSEVEMIVTTHGEKWRIDRHPLSWNQDLEITDAIRKNRFSQYIDKNNLRDQIYAWDGESQRTFTYSKGPLGGLMTVSPGHPTSAGLAEEVIRLGRGDPAFFQRLAKAEPAITEANSSTGAIHVNCNIDNRRITCQISPQYDYSLIQFEIIDDDGSMFSTIKSDFKLFDGVWLPRTVIAEAKGRVGNEIKTVIRDYWTIMDAKYPQLLPNEKELFVNIMRQTGTVVDYHFKRPFTYRTDGDLDVAEKTVLAIETVKEAIDSSTNTSHLLDSSGGKAITSANVERRDGHYYLVAIIASGMFIMVGSLLLYKRKRVRRVKK